MPQTDLTLVLFDIDGTLLDTHGAGRRAFAQTLKTVFGWNDNVEHINFSGTTDLDVFHRLMKHHGHVPLPEDLEKFFGQLPIELTQTIAEQTLTLHPGVREVLEFLSRDKRVIAGLVTGNIEAGAQIKLKHLNLHGHFILGAFGHEHADRNEIARLALRRAEAQLKPGQNFRAKFLIGDTPFDIRAAHAIGAQSIGVATGTYSEQQLREAGATHVLPNLSDLPHLRAILGLNKS